MEELLQAFLGEAEETVATLEQDVARLSVDHPDAEVVVRVYRGIHTIKGTCGFLGLDRLESLTASGELLLGRLQSGRLRLSGEIIAAVAELVSAVGAALTVLAETGGEGDGDDRELRQRLEQLARTAEPA